MRSPVGISGLQAGEDVKGLHWRRPLQPMSIGGDAGRNEALLAAAVDLTDGAIKNQ